MDKEDKVLLYPENRKDREYTGIDITDSCGRQHRIGEYISGVVHLDEIRLNADLSELVIALRGTQQLNE